jgi:AcrR family transcriptional regulator
MEVEKRERVINAAMHEFSTKGGYKAANTDTIVREAGISKGLLFHYFGCKEKLYEFLKAYAIDVITREYTALLNFESRDVLEVMWQSVLLKADLSYKYADIFDFITTAYMEEKDSPGGKLMSAVAPLQEEMFSKMISTCDKSLFKDSVNIEKAINIVRWSLIGYSNSQMHSSNIADYQKEYGRYIEEVQAYFTMFRKLFYREEST